MGSKIFPQSSSNKTIYQEDDKIEKLKLPYNLDRILKQKNIKSIGKFFKVKRKRLLRIKGIGKKYSWLLMKRKQNIIVNYHEYIPRISDNTHKYPQEEIFKHLDLPKEVFMDDPIDMLGFPTRVENALKNHGIETIGEFSETPLIKMMKFRNIGSKSLDFFEKVQKQITNNKNPESFKDDGISKQISIFDIQHEEQIPNDLLVQLLIERAGNDRSIDIIKRRFGFDSGEKQTLDEIGKDYGITRERVRQIQKRSIQRIKHPSTKGRSTIISIINDIFQKNQFIISDSEADYLIGKVFNSSKFDGSSFLDMISELGWIQKNKIGDMSFYTSNDLKPTLSLIMTDVYSLLKTNTTMVSLEEIIKSITSSYTIYSENFDLKVIVKRICSLDPRIEEKMLERYTLYGLHSRTNIWASLIKEVLEKEGEPLHFADITNSVNDMFSNTDNNHIDVRRLHSILIENNTFSHSGVKGTYGLTEWGFRKETTSELIEESIRKAGFALHWKQIYNYVSKYKDTKPGNILAILNSRDRFTRKGRGMYEVTN